MNRKVFTTTAQIVAYAEERHAAVRAAFKTTETRVYGDLLDLARNTSDLADLRRNLFRLAETSESETESNICHFVAQRITLKGEEHAA